MRPACKPGSIQIILGLWAIGTLPVKQIVDRESGSRRAYDIPNFSGAMNGFRFWPGVERLRFLLVQEQILQGYHNNAINGDIA
jgi:hypothetical protein